MTRQTEPSPSSAGPLRRVLRWPLAHWRGELPLWVSFWLHGAGVYALLALLSRLHEQASLAETLHPLVVVRLSLVYLLFALMINLWLAVGIWRAARHHQAARRLPGWGTVAQVVVAFSVAFSLAGMLFMAPLASHLWRTAFASGQIDRYRIMVLKGGELLVEGGIGWGLARDLEGVLTVHRRIHTVVLDSPGGWLTEGRRLRDLLARRQVTARVVRRCFSACAVAYMGAPHRELRAGALLGFHLPSATGLSLGRGYVWSEAYRKLVDDQGQMLAQGVHPDFVRHVFTTPHEGMWVPPLTDLVASGVVTRVLPPMLFPPAPEGAQTPSTGGAGEGSSVN